MNISSIRILKRALVSGKKMYVRYSLFSVLFRFDQGLCFDRQRIKKVNRVKSQLCILLRNSITKINALLKL